MLPPPRKPYANAALAHRRLWRGRIGMMLVGSLSVLAGMTDAIGFMASGDFVSFMSGNTTRLAVAIGAGDHSLTVRLLLLVSTFVLGNALGIVVSRFSRRHALPLLAPLRVRIVPADSGCPGEVSVLKLAVSECRRDAFLCIGERCELETGWPVMN